MPQAMRGMAVLAWIDCWVDRYRPGERYGLKQREVSDRLKAAAMLESWFQHRAVNENSDGNRDLGIAQASEYMRSRLRVLYVRGQTDFGLAEDDYSDPWKATRALVFWFSLILDEVGGDLDRATGAYHVGSRRSRSGRSKAYRNEVARLQASHVNDPSPSPTWNWLRARSPSPCPLFEEPDSPDPTEEPATREDPESSGTRLRTGSP